MARKLRLQHEGAIYHITVRGNGRRPIFKDDNDRERLLWLLSESKETYGVSGGAGPLLFGLLCRYADMTQRDAGKLLGYRTGSAVNMQLGRMMERLRSDTKLRALLSRLERKLEKATA